MQNSTTLERKQNFVVVGKKLHLFFHLGTLEVQKQRILYGQMLNNIRGGGHTVIIVVVYKAHNQQIKNQSKCRYPQVFRPRLFSPLFKRSNYIYFTSMVIPRPGSPDICRSRLCEQGTFQHSLKVHNRKYNNNFIIM